MCCQNIIHLVNMIQASNKIQYLEGIRGVAAMMVVFHHFFLAFYPAYYFGGEPSISHLGTTELNYWRSPLSFLTNGDFMVCVFFVLSGYVLSRAYFKSNNIETLVSSAARRFFRLYIPLAVALIIAFIVLKCGFKAINQTVVTSRSAWLFQTVPEDQSFGTFLRYLLYRTMFFIDNHYVTSTWTISIEFFGSMLVFASLALTHGIKHKWFFSIVPALIGYFFFNEYYMAFAFGILMNYLEKVNTEKIKYRGFLVAIMLILGLIMGGYPSWQLSVDKETFYSFASHPLLVEHCRTIHVVGAAFIIASAILSSTFQKIFSGKLFVFLGDVSFSSYLIHPIIVTTITLWVFLGIYNGQDNYGFATFISLIVTVIVTLIMAKIMTVYVDKPATRFSKNLYTRFFKAN